MWILIVILVCLVIFLFWFAKHRKKICVSQINLITGAPKTGKTLCALYLAHKDYKKRLFRWKIKSFFQKFFKKQISEKPLFYSNIPVKFPYVELTPDLLLRKKRFSFDSVIFIDEAYLVADSMSFGVEAIDDALSYFYKLIGHELHGGSLFVDTQSVKDCHYSIKRCATTYLFIESKQNYPFFLRLNCREIINSDEVSIYNTSNCDVKDDPSFHILLIPKKYYKYYDCYALSKLTDNLEVEDNVIDTCDGLKTDVILSIKQIVKSEKLKNKQ